jgi:hypothetical protein
MLKAFSAAGISLLNNRFRVPGSAGVYVGIIDPSGHHFNKYFVWAWCWRYNVIAIDQFINPAMAH